MDSQWGQYPDSSTNRQARYSHSYQSTPQQQPREFGAAQQHQAPAGYTYESYQSSAHSSQIPSMASSASATPNAREYAGDQDVAMEDVDPYARSKYPSRPTHSQRSSAQYLGLEESSAARRYSPMNMLSPSSPYTAPPTQSTPSYAPPPQPHSNRGSPTRPPLYSSQSHNHTSSYHASPSECALTLSVDNQSTANALETIARQQQPPLLPPMQSPSDNMSPESYYPPPSAKAQLNAVFGREMKPESRSPLNYHPQSSTPSRAPSRGPVPRFTKVRSVQELRPRVNQQPAFRRANPEGGFISVSPLSY